MIIYQAILTACLISAPQTCRTHEMLITAGANPVSAFVEAQTRAAQWLSSRPGLKQRSLTVRVGRGV